MLDEIRTLYAYNSWANQRVKDKAGELTRDQYYAEEGASHGSVHQSLVHTMSAQWIWLSRWQGTSPTAMFDSAEFVDLVAIRSRWNVIEADMLDYLAGLQANQLDTVVAYRNTQGAEWAYPLWQQLLHQVNHATQHRSEIAVILTRYEASPGDLDFLVYIDHQSS